MFGCGKKTVEMCYRKTTSMWTATENIAGRGFKALGILKCGSLVSKPQRNHQQNFTRASEIHQLQTVLREVMPLNKDLGSAQISHTLQQIIQGANSELLLGVKATENKGICDLEWITAGAEDYKI